MQLTLAALSRGHQRAAVCMAQHGESCGGGGLAGARTTALHGALATVLSAALLTSPMPSMAADGAAIARHREGVEPPPLTFYKLLQYRQERTPFSHMSHPIPPTSHRFNSCSLSL